MQTLCMAFLCIDAVFEAKDDRCAVLEAENVFVSLRLGTQIIEMVVFALLPFPRPWTLLFVGVELATVAVEAAVLFDCGALEMLVGKVASSNMVAECSRGVICYFISVAISSGAFNVQLRFSYDQRKELERSACSSRQLLGWACARLGGDVDLVRKAVAVLQAELEATADSPKSLLRARKSSANAQLHAEAADALAHDMVTLLKIDEVNCPCGHFDRASP
jgi:hypothetical protein